MQEGKRVIPEKSYVRVIRECGEIKCVAEKCSKEITRTAGEEREEEKLYDVEMKVKGEERAIRDLIRFRMSAICLIFPHTRFRRFEMHTSKQYPNSN